MTSERPQTALRLGFLCADSFDDIGFVGGLLVTNRFGRPLEFQCTTPVQPNRTQEILYGPTLVPFVLGELIGRTLIEKVGVKPQLVMIEQPEMLEVRQHISVPVGCLSSDETRSSRSIALGRETIFVQSAREADFDAIQRMAGEIPGGANLLEPFQRIREALREAVGVTVTQ